MSWQRCTFKGKSKVWAEVDDEGGFVTDDDGRVAIRYQDRAEAKVYRAHPANLSPSDAAQPSAGARSKASANPARAANFDDDVWRKPAGPHVVIRDIPAELASLSGPPEGVWEFFTDGACSGNPGRCGWGLVMRHDHDYREEHQYIGIGTNNIAELMAIKVALEAVDDPAAEVHIHSDSKYSIDILTKGWKAKKNKELIESIKARMAFFDRPPVFFKVKGHAGHPFNERADHMATSSIAAGADPKR